MGPGASVDGPPLLPLRRRQQERLERHGPAADRQPARSRRSCSGTPPCATSRSTTATITNSRDFAVRYEQAAAGIVLANITSTGSGQLGFYSSLGTNPPGVTFVNDSFD